MDNTVRTDSIQSYRPASSAGFTPILTSFYNSRKLNNKQNCQPKSVHYNFIRCPTGPAIIPTLGTFYSHTGNILFPPWEL